MRKILITASAVALAGACAHAAQEPATLSDLEILKSYAADFEHDPALTDAITFGVKSGDDFYTIEATPAAEGKPASVTAHPGAPDAPSFYYTLDAGWLQKLHAGEFNALTSMAKAFSSDVTPMDIDAMEGFQPADDFGGWVIPFSFHFWTKGQPEMVAISPDKTRFTHGTNAGILYYQPGLRSGWFDIRPGQHVNENEKSRENPFPSMFIMIKGEATAIIDGKRVPFREGTMMFVPAGVSHEFINEGTAPAFGFLFMFGEGA